MKAQNFLLHVRERAVTHIMKQGCRARCRSIFIGNPVTFPQATENTRHQVKHAERVREARMLCALIGVEGQTQLLDAAQALKLRRVNQTRHQLPCVRVRAKANDVVDRVAVDAFGHCSYIFFRVN